jgi:hypothetical protein
MTELSAVSGRNDLVRLGVYRHHNHTDRHPRFYQVIGIARHTFTEEKGVVYIPLYVAGGPRMAFRPLDNFIEILDKDGKKVPRFQYVGTEIPEFSI